MKKVNILLLIFLCLFVNIILLNPAFAVAATFKEGIYTHADLNVSLGNAYTIKNISKTKGVRILIYDEDHNDMETIKLDPDSTEIDVVTIKPNYIIVVTGDGEVTIAPKSP